MNTRTLIVLLASALLAMGCAKVSPKNPYCESVDAGAVANRVLAKAERTEIECIHKHAHLLASERDGADVIARAVVQRCWGEILLARAEMPQLPNEPSEYWRRAENEAIDVVVTDRSAGCANPGANK